MTSNSKDDLTTSALARALKLSGLAGRIAASQLGTGALQIFRSEESREKHKKDTQNKNAERIAATLGELKGAVMKFGQLLSMYEGFLPPEVLKVLTQLQQEAPPVSFAVIRRQLQNELGERMAQFARINPRAYASASIGQVHRAKLHDGRELAIKIQYPEMDRIICADLKNLKKALKTLFRMIPAETLEKVWDELEIKLLEELDYTLEAAHLKRMTELFQDDSDFIFPEVLPELSTRRVLTMTFVAGLPRSTIQAPESQEIRNRLGVGLVKFFSRSFFKHHFLHADPNFANFALHEDGRLIVYDFGCMKEIPPRLAAQYARLMAAIQDLSVADLPDLLYQADFYMKDGQKITTEFIQPHAEMIHPMFQRNHSHSFGDDPQIYERIMELGRQQWWDSLGIHFPKDVVFIQRTLNGLFGNLNHLGSTACWGDILEEDMRQHL